MRKDEEIIVNGFLDADLLHPVTVAEMRSIEGRGEAMGISKSLMMENAGSSVARFIFENKDYFYDGSSISSKLRVLFIAGTGNNGGDLYAAARHLAYWSEFCSVSVALIGTSSDIHATEAKSNFEILRKVSSVEIVQIGAENDIPIFSTLLANSDLLVVGIFGTGFKGESRPLQSQIISLINADRHAKKISVDIPSGLEADTGNFKTAVRSNYTITMHAPKVGMQVNEAARDLSGRILVANIGVPT
jgi:hydroxyethylthiazole kinase-like uncharacterized protein yjeF